MPLIKNVLNLWRADDLLSQAWAESHKMLNLSRELFVQSVKALREQKNNETIKTLKKRDKKINDYQANVRRKVLTHFVIKEDVSDIANGLLLVNMVVDIERLGDYCKNILNLAISTPETVAIEHLSKDLKEIEDEVLNRFDKAITAITNQDEEIAKDLIANQRKIITKTSDKIIDQVLSGDIKLGNDAQAATLVLYARYLKRIASHLTNIATILVYPLDKVGDF